MRRCAGKQPRARAAGRAAAGDRAAAFGRAVREPAPCVPLGFKVKVCAHSALNTCPQVNIVFAPVRYAIYCRNAPAFNIAKRAQKRCPARLKTVTWLNSAAARCAISVSTYYECACITLCLKSRKCLFLSSRFHWLV